MRVTPRSGRSSPGCLESRRSFSVVCIFVKVGRSVWREGSKSGFARAMASSRSRSRACPSRSAVEEEEDEDNTCSSPSVLRDGHARDRDLDEAIARANPDLDPSRQTLRPTLTKMQTTLNDLLDSRQPGEDLPERGVTLMTTSIMVMMSLMAFWVGVMGLLLSAAGSQAIYVHSPEGEPPTYCSLFNHMVKAGGSTIKDSLLAAATMEGVSPPGLCVNGPGTEEACMHALHNSPVITGYAELIRYPLESIGRQCDYWTVMRHPIDRLVSAFFYCPTDHDVQPRPDKWCGYREDPAPLEQRLVEFAQLGWKNKAFRQMTFGLFCPPTAFCEQTKPGAPQAVDEPNGWDLLQQIETILGSYTAVGILEEWDLTMDLFNAKVKSPVKDWREQKKSNPGQASDVRSRLLSWAHRSPEIHRAMSTDMLLYDYAYSVFREQTSETLGTEWET